MTHSQILIIIQLIKAAQSLAAQLTEALAELRQHVQSLLNTQQPEDAERRWAFLPNDYTVLAIWLLHDPTAHDMFPVDKKKSWEKLAKRLSMYVGWTVDPHILRQNYNRRYLKKTKKA